MTHAGWNGSGIGKEEIYMIIALSDFMNKCKEITDKNSSKFHNRFTQLTTERSGNVLKII